MFNGELVFILLYIYAIGMCIIGCFYTLAALTKINTEQWLKELLCNEYSIYYPTLILLIALVSGSMVVSFTFSKPNTGPLRG